MSKGRGIQSIEVGGRLLEVLAQSGHPMMLRDLALGSDLVPAQVHAYLTSFARLGLVEQDPRTGHYALGHFASRLGLARLRSAPIYVRATDAVRHLADTLEAMVMMVTWGPAMPTAVQVQDGATLNLNIRRGTSFNLNTTASGRVFLAYPPNDQCRPTTPTQESLASAVRARGFAESIDEPIPGISAYSAPVFDKNHTLAAALTIVGRSEAFAKGDNALNQLLEATGALTRANADGSEGNLQ